MGRVRDRIADKRVLSVVKAFLKAGILDEDRQLRETNAGTPQVSILSPLLSNIALTVLDEHIAQQPGGPNSSPAVRAGRLQRGLPNFKLVRYADDWCLMIRGSRTDAVALRDEIAGVLRRLVATQLGVSVLPFSASIEQARARETRRSAVPDLDHPYLMMRIGNHGSVAGAPHTRQLAADEVMVHPTR